MTITAVDNGTDGNDKTVTVSGAATNTQGVTDPSSVTLTITDDDGAPMLSINSPSVTEGDTGSANLTFTVTLSAASDKEVTVGYADAGSGDATGGTDYTALTAGTLTFAAGDTSGTITVSVTATRRTSRTRRLRVTLSGASNATVSAALGDGNGDDHGRRRCSDGFAGSVPDFDHGERRDQCDDGNGEPGPRFERGHDDRGVGGGGNETRTPTTSR